MFLSKKLLCMHTYSIHSVWGYLTTHIILKCKRLLSPDVFPSFKESFLLEEPACLPLTDEKYRSPYAMGFFPFRQDQHTIHSLWLIGHVFLHLHIFTDINFLIFYTNRVLTQTWQVFVSCYVFSWISYFPQLRMYGHMFDCSALYCAISVILIW